MLECLSRFVRETGHRVALIGALGGAAFVCALPTAAHADTGNTDVRLRVVLYQASGVGSTATETVPFTTKDVSADVYTPLLAQIKNSHPLYAACSYDLSKTTAECDPSIANVLVTLQFTADPKSPKPDKPRLLATMRSFDMINGRTLATLSLGTVDPSTITAGDPASVKDALSPLVPSATQISTLLGTATIANNGLSLLHGFEPYVQLVPTLTNADDPTYLPLLANLLDRRGIPSVPSQFNAGVVASGSTPLDVICGRGQRYLVYQLSTENYPHPVNFSTRIETHASAQLFDCTNMTVVPVGLDEHMSVLTTQTPLTSLLAIIETVFFPNAKALSPVPLKAIGLVSPFVDADPEKDPVKHSVADRALQGLVDRLCSRLDHMPSPPAAPAPPMIVMRVPTSTTQPLTRQQRIGRAEQTLSLDLNKAKNDQAKRKKAFARFNATMSLIDIEPPPPEQGKNPTPAAAPQPATQSTATLVSLDVSGFLAPSPPPLKCRGRRLDRMPDPPAAGSRWTKTR